MALKSSLGGRMRPPPRPGSRSASMGTREEEKWLDMVLLAYREEKAMFG